MHLDDSACGRLAWPTPHLSENAFGRLVSANWPVHTDSEKMHFGPFIVILKECTYGRMHIHCIKIAIERKQPTEAEKECNSCAKIRGGEFSWEAVVGEFGELGRG